MKLGEQEELKDYGGANAFCYEAGAAETGCHCLAGEGCHCAARNEVLVLEMFSMI